MNEAVSRIDDSGQDPKGLGRWCWVRLTGKDGRFTHIISAYRPVLNTTGDFSTYNQQKHYYEKVEEDFEICPRQAFTDELEDEIERFKLAGDEVFLCIDLNENIRGDNSFNDAMDRQYMTEALTYAHGLDGPPTRRGSRHPIDGIWMTDNLESTASGYSEYIEGVGDHRPLWLDAPRSNVFGQEKGASKISAARRLKCIDPRVVQKYLKSYDEYLRRHGLYTLPVKVGKKIDKRNLSHQETDSRV